VLPLLAAGLVVLYGLRAGDRWSASAFGLILGGALGNVIDRAGLSYVIDFLLIDVVGRPVVILDRVTIMPWPVFNLADAFVFGGAVMLIGRELLRRPAKAATVPAVVTVEGEQPSA